MEQAVDTQQDSLLKNSGQECMICIVVATCLDYLKSLACGTASRRCYRFAPVDGLVSLGDCLLCSCKMHVVCGCCVQFENVAPTEGSREPYNALHASTAIPSQEAAVVYGIIAPMHSLRTIQECSATILSPRALV